MTWEATRKIERTPCVIYRAKKESMMTISESSAFKTDLGNRIEAQGVAYYADGFPTAAVRIDRLNRAVILLIDHKEEIAAALSTDFGHRSREATLIVEIFAAVASLRHAAANVEQWMAHEIFGALAPGAVARVEHIPVGVVGIIGPWNFPYYLIFAPLAGVLAAGNRAIIKPSEFTPRSSQLLQQLVAASFAPEELSVVLGGPAEGADFASSPFDHLIFTGSSAVAKHVLRSAAEHLTPVTLELGGKSPVIVTDQYDMAEAAARVMTIKTLNAGQICLAPDYVLVPEGREREFADACVSATQAIFPDGVASTDYTSVITERHFARLSHIVEDAREKGTIIVEALSSVNGQKDRLFPPTILVSPGNDTIAMQEEIFGPVLPVVGYATLEDALAKVRSGPRPLALYYFGADDEAARTMLDGTASGGVTINDVMTHVFSEELPFGGIGASGTGSYHGKAGFLTFSHARSIYRQSDAQEAAMLFRPPYGEGIKQFLSDALAN